MHDRADWTRALLLALLAFAGCGKKPTRPTTSPPATALYVVNSLGETLDRVDPEQGTVDHDLAVLGAQPNDVLVDGRGSVWVLNSGDNTLLRFDGATGAKTGTAAMGVGSNPYLMTVVPTGLAVSDWLTGDVALVDTTARVVTDRIPVGRTPQGVLHAAGRLFVAVGNYDGPTATYGPGEVAVIEDGAATVSARIPVGVNPQVLLEGPDGNVHVICTGNYGFGTPPVYGRVWVIDPVTLAAVDSLNLGGSPGAAAAAGSIVYVSAYFGGLMEYDGIAHVPLRTDLNPVLNTPGLSGMAYDAARKRLYVAGFEDDAVYSVDTTADTLAATWSVGDGPLAVALDFGSQGPRAVPRR